MILALFLRKGDCENLWSHAATKGTYSLNSFYLDPERVKSPSLIPRYFLDILDRYLLKQTSLVYCTYFSPFARVSPVFHITSITLVFWGFLRFLVPSSRSPILSPASRPWTLALRMLRRSRLLCETKVYRLHSVGVESCFIILDGVLHSVIYFRRAILRV